MLTKVVVTVGPATADEERILALAELGVDVVRINFAHGSHEDHARTIEWTRRAAERVGRPIAVLVDLAGPKIRIGELPAPVTLREGDRVTIAPEAVAAGDELPTTYAALADDVRPGDRILLDDGMLELQVEEVRPPRLTALVVRGGLLRSHKGLNLPGVRLSVEALTEKDLGDLDFALHADVDYIGLSFVQRPEDVRDLRRRIRGRGPLIVAKIEKDTALEHLEGILEETDAVMVARGDLGVELPFEQVPLAQKRIIRLANLYGRPVITATQMLESMIASPRPTRAEASDVANALLDGTDAVMLSGETAVGSYPLLAVEALVRIAREIESSTAFRAGPRHDVPREPHLHNNGTPTEHAIAAATAQAVGLLDAPAIVTITRSGFTARVISSYRPPVPIIAVSTEARTVRQLALVWGVQTVVCPENDTYEGMLACARDFMLAKGIATRGQRVVVTAGIPFQSPGTTNMLRVEEL